MPKPSYSVIYNEDWMNTLSSTIEPIGPRNLELLVDEVADGGADVFLLNPNAQRVNYPSKVWQTMWDGYRAGDRSWFGLVPENQVPGREHTIRQALRLVEQDCDFLAYTMAHCRRRNIVGGVTIRMNDRHDAELHRTHNLSDFFIEHPEFRVIPHKTSPLNYEHKEVRNLYLSLIREIVNEYDIQVLDLDFLRSPPHFPANGRYKDYAEIMTSVVRQVRRLTQQATRPITLMARVPAWPSGLKEVCLDVERWSHEDLVDAITIGSFLNSGWQLPVEKFRKMLGPKVALYVSNDGSADRREGLPARNMPCEPEMMRGFASSYLSRGVDGIYVFNFFSLRQSPVFMAQREESRDKHGPPCFYVLGQMKSREELRGQDKTYLVTASSHPYTQYPNDPPVQLPTDLILSQCRSFKLFMDSEQTNMQAKCVITYKGHTATDRLWLRINDEPIGYATETAEIDFYDREREVMVDSDSFQSVAFEVPLATIHEGLNTIELRNDGDTVRVIGIEMQMRKGITS